MIQTLANIAALGESYANAILESEWLRVLSNLVINGISFEERIIAHKVSFLILYFLFKWVCVRGHSFRCKAQTFHQPRQLFHQGTSFVKFAKPNARELKSSNVLLKQQSISGVSKCSSLASTHPIFPSIWCLRVVLEYGKSRIKQGLVHMNIIGRASHRRRSYSRTARFRQLYMEAEGLLPQ